MEIVDGWATGYGNKKFSIGVDEGDWLLWLREAGVEPDKISFQSGMSALRVKARIMRMLAQAECATALAEWHEHEGEPAGQQQALADLRACEAELENWAKVLWEKFGVST